MTNKECMIRASEISVVFQGPIDEKLTSKAINYIRKNYPEAEIIVSTWEGSDISKIKADRIILNKDPGCSYDGASYERALNVNRWIVSSKTGVLASTRRFVLKCRTDVEIESFGFLAFWDSFPERLTEYALAKHKIIIPSVYTMRFLGDGKKHHIIKTPFHVSDWYCFGFREDIIDFVSCPVISNLHAFARYYDNKRYLVPYDCRWWMDFWFRRMAAEQYIGLHYAKRKFADIDISNVFEFKDITDELSEKFLISNFIVLDPIQYGIHLPKFGSFTKKIYILDDDLWRGLYTNSVFRKAYCKTFNKHDLVLDWQNAKRDLRKYYELARHIFKLIMYYSEKVYIGIIKLIRRFIQKHPILHIISFEINHVQKGKKIFNALIRRHPNEGEIFICPYRGTGDSYIVGNYFRDKNIHGIFVVPRKLNQKILSWFGISNVEIFGEKELSLLLDYQRIIQNPRVHIVHFDCGAVWGSTGYNLAGFKNLNFADFYDYIVFGEHKPIKYKPIQANTDDVYRFCEGLEKGKTAILAPYSDSIDSLPMHEWEYIVRCLKNMGLSVVTNCGGEEKPIKGSKAVFVPFDKMVDFANYCGYFISVRSGLCDIISTSQCKKIIFYPDFIQYKYGSYKDFFTLNIEERDISVLEYEYKRKENRKIINVMIKELMNFDKEAKIV